MEQEKISEDLFKKIRSRFPDVVIGDADGNVTNMPKAAKFFDFDYKGLGKVSISLDEDGFSVIYSKDFISNEDELTKKDWYDFLKELRVFSKKRMLDFSVRDINKTNLTKRDYKFLANRSGDDTMTESKLYGTSRVSYQKVGEARIMIKHTENINQESATGRIQKIGKIYIESPEGERFKYPYKHLSGARAMARHVAEGGNAYDDFGKHIVGLSEELAKLRKFKTYMGRSAVMAESLAGYMDVVKERISTVKKTIESLQKPAAYKEAFESFESPVLEDVPSDVAENWIDELTIKQFNEELADVFPYIYNLVKEGTKAKELGPDDLLGESDEQLDEIAPLIAAGIMTAARAAVPQLTRIGANIIARGGSAAAKGAGAAAKGVGTMAVKHPIATSVAGGAAYAGKKAGDAIDAVGDMAADLKGDADALIAQAGAGIEAIQDQVTAAIGSSGFLKVANFASKYALPALAVVALLYGGKKVINWLMGKGDEPKTKEEFELEQAFEDTMGQFADSVCEECGNPSWRTLDEEKQKGVDGKVCWKGYKRMGTKMKGGKRVDNCVKIKDDIEMEGIDQDTVKKNALEALVDIAKTSKKYKGEVKDEQIEILGGLIQDMDNAGIEPEKYSAVNELFKAMSTDKKADVTMIQPAYAQVKQMGEGNAYSGAVAQAKKDGKKKGDKIQGPDGDEITLEKDQKTPLGEFILSYYDRETGLFPKGETAVLTMVEKDYGEEFIEPAKAFIEQVQALFDEYQMQTQPQQLDTEGFDRMKELAGLR